MILQVQTPQGHTLFILYTELPTRLHKSYVTTIPILFYRSLDMKHPILPRPHLVLRTLHVDEGLPDKAERVLRHSPGGVAGVQHQQAETTVGRPFHPADSPTMALNSVN